METFEQAVEAERAEKDSSASTTPAPSTDTSADTEARADADGDTTQPETKPTGKVVKLPDNLKPQKATGRFQQRISDLVQSRRQAEDEARRLREENAQLKAGSVARPGAAAPSKTTAADPNAPLNPEDFETYADYVQAIVDRTVEQREAAKQNKQSQTAYEQYKQEKQTEFETHAAPLAEQYGEGFWDAITDPQLPVSEPMVDAIMELGEMAPYTMLWLAANKTEAAKMFKMNPRQATMAIGRLSAKLTAELEADGGNVGSTEQGQAGTAATAPQRPRPTLVPTPRGGAPANGLDGQPSDKDDINTWLQKETNRIRRMNPNARFYGSR